MLKKYKKIFSLKIFFKKLIIISEFIIIKIYKNIKKKYFYKFSVK